LTSMLTSAKPASVSKVLISSSADAPATQQE